jgi:NADPH:quinone reductase-like Zn-dependent oxidoreductase
VIGTVARRSATVPVGMILGKRLMLRGTMLRRARSTKNGRDGGICARRAPLLASGTVRPTVDHVYELDEIRAAHERLASNATFGKVVLRM